MALVESHPLAFQIEEFIYNLRDHLLALNLAAGTTWQPDPLQPGGAGWVLPDRNTIPHDVAFFQKMRGLDRCWSSAAGSEERNIMWDGVAVRQPTPARQV